MVTSPPSPAVPGHTVASPPFAVTSVPARMASEFQTVMVPPWPPWVEPVAPFEVMIPVVEVATVMCPPLPPLVPLAPFEVMEVVVALYT